MVYIDRINSFYDIKHLSGVFVLVLLYLFTRFILVRVVKNWALKDLKNKQSWLNIAKRLPGLILFIGILFIWGQELRDFALSLVAVAAALVLATKEVILCFMGGLLRASTKLFEDGDRISVSGLRGKVIEQTLLTTTLAEIGPSNTSNQSTGKLLKLPNSLFLNNAVTVVPSNRDFILHIVTITMPFGPDWQEMEKMLLASAYEVMEIYKDDFDKFAKKNAKFVKNYSLGSEPRVFFEINSKDSIQFSVRLTLPYDGLGKTESAIIKNFLQKVSQLKRFNEANEEELNS